MEKNQVSVYFTSDKKPIDAHFIL